MPQAATIRDETIERELERFHRASFGWALACCGYDREEAQDVLQSAYLRAIEGRARFNGHSAVRTWFFGVVRHTAAEHRRRRVVRRLSLERWWRSLPVPDPVVTPEGASSASETEGRLRSTLLRLSPRQRDLLHLVFYQDLTIEQAAEVLGLNVGTARTHYERGKARLRTLLAIPGDES